MFGLTSGQIILLLGASAVLIGPKDMPVFARVAGKLAGKAVAQVQSVRSEMDGILRQSQASQVHKEIQDAISQLDAIRHEIRNATVINRAPHTRVSLSEEDESLIEDSVVSGAKKVEQETSEVFKKDSKAMKTDVTDFHQEANEFLKRASKAVKTDGTDFAQLQSRAAAYSRLAEASKTQNNFSGVQFSQEQADIENTLGHTQISVLPVSAESAGLLPKDRGTTGSDFVLEAILEANVAETAQEYFKEPEIQEKAKEYFSDPEIQEKMHTSDTSNKN